LITPVLLVGGGGSRLWPMSTPAAPKQFAALTAGRSLMGETLARFGRDESSGGNLEFSGPLIVGSAQHQRRLAREIEAAGIGTATLLLEPCARNTAPAIAVAALVLSERAVDGLMLIAPSDHHITDVAAFHRAIATAIRPARAGRLVTFGVTPTHPETGYGYIRRGPADGAGGAFRVERFVEKPSLDVAREYVESGGFDWNAGIFLFTAGAIIEALARHAGEVLACARAALAGAQRNAGAVHLEATAFSTCPAISIDNAVMAVSDRVCVVPVAMGWSDVGSWDAVHAIGTADGNGNVVRGRVLAEDVSGVLLRADTGIVAALGVSDVAVVKTGDCVLVTSLGRSQDVRVIEQRVAGLGAPGGRDGGQLGALAPAARELSAWMREKALPLWAERGWDDRRGGFREALGLDGAPCPEPYRRIRVQARQIYAFAAAHLLGWPGPALEIAWRGFDYLVARGWLAEGGWAHKLDRDGRVIDGARDAYDHAFVLFALAWLHRASGDEEPLIWADRTIAWLDAVLIDPVHGGYRESVPETTPRRANPHMHLLEALLALHDATRNPAYLDRADKLVRLFRDRFLDRRTQSLTEHFNTDWSPAGGKAGKAREPGHHFEWAWLLDAHAARLGGAADDEIAALVRFADRHGTNEATGLVHDAVGEDGAIVSTTHRLWCQTEAIRARMMLAGRGRAGEAEKAARLACSLRRFHLDPAPVGLWRDCVDVAGNPLDATVPASTMYHLMTLVFELDSRLSPPDPAR